MDAFERTEEMITEDQGRDLAQKLGAFRFCECSAKTGDGVRDVFEPPRVENDGYPLSPTSPDGHEDWELMSDSGIYMGSDRAGGGLRSAGVASRSGMGHRRQASATGMNGMPTRSRYAQLALGNGGGVSPGAPAATTARPRMSMHERMGMGAGATQNGSASAAVKRRSTPVAPRPVQSATTDAPAAVLAEGRRLKRSSLLVDTTSTNGNGTTTVTTTLNKMLRRKPSGVLKSKQSSDSPSTTTSSSSPPRSSSMASLAKRRGSTTSIASVSSVSSTNTKRASTTSSTSLSLSRPRSLSTSSSSSSLHNGVPTYRSYSPPRPAGKDDPLMKRRSIPASTAASKSSITTNSSAKSNTRQASPPASIRSVRTRSNSPPTPSSTRRRSPPAPTSSSRNATATTATTGTRSRRNSTISNVDRSSYLATPAATPKSGSAASSRNSSPPRPAVKIAANSAEGAKEEKKVPFWKRLSVRDPGKAAAKQQISATTPVSAKKSASGAWK
ncbi:hypothetical protein HK102_013251 [Quaeritorhiza haematococci]|nr:hypothetical protein HK102_013251 [Quaeritorhiza haematococci]